MSDDFGGRMWERAEIAEREVAALRKENSDLKTLISTERDRFGDLECKLLAEVEQLKTERNEASAEAAETLRFLGAELDWEYFRSGMLYSKEKEPEKQNQSENNARLIKEFLAETGHGLRFLAERDSLKARLERALDALRQTRINMWIVGTFDDEWVAEQNAKIDAALSEAPPSQCSPPTNSKQTSALEETSENTFEPVTDCLCALCTKIKAGPIEKPIETHSAPKTFTVEEIERAYRAWVAMPDDNKSDLWAEFRRALGLTPSENGSGE